MVVQIAITNNKVVQYPVLLDDITLSRYRRGSPSKIKFSVYKDSSLNVQEGDPVLMQLDGKNVFYGFVFCKTRKGSAEQKVEITAYDQLRYFKNKDSFSYKATPDELIRLIASRYKLTVGTLAPVKYRLSRIESVSALLDIVETALDETLCGTGKMYIFYDDAGKLMLSDSEDMKLPIFIDADSLCDYTYKSSIDKDTYNQIKVLYDTATSTEAIVLSDETNIKNWGVLQHIEKAKGVDPILMAQNLLSLYNDMSRTLTLSSVLGDIRVRGGSFVLVKLNLGDILIQNYMMVEEATHKFKNGIHLMDLKVRGGSFVI